MSGGHIASGVVVWRGKPWVVPVAIVRTATIFVVLGLFLWFEAVFNVAFVGFAGLSLYVWTVLVFGAVWLLSLFSLLFFWASHTYTLRQDSLEVRRGIIRLHSFVVTPSGFGDLTVYQSVGGRIFGYADLTVTTQGERKTRLLFVRMPYLRANAIRDIMGKPIVRVER